MAVAVVNGCNITFERAGIGPVSVIFETGLGAESFEWEPIFRQITKRTLGFRYDRAGRGESGAVSQPRNALEMSFDLDAVLEAAEIQPPFLLVGHSFGGPLMRIFAQRRRVDVCGLVLVESMHPRQFDVLGPAFPKPMENEPLPLTQVRAFWQSRWKHPDSTPERIDLQRSMRQDEEVHNLDDLPLRLVTAASFLNNPLLKERAQREEMQALWNELQSSFCKLSINTKSTYLERAGHFVQRDDPDAVTRVIAALLEEL